MAQMLQQAIKEQTCLNLEIAEDTLVLETSMEESFQYLEDLNLSDDQDGCAKNPYNGISFRELRKDMKMVNNQIYKKLLKLGAGSDVDIENNIIKYEFSMFIERADESFSSSKRGVVNINDGIEPLPGCFLALQTMKLHEQSLFLISSDLMYGRVGCPPMVPTAADILFLATIKKESEYELSKKEQEKLKSTKSLLISAMKASKEAMQRFNCRNTQQCLEIYQKWISILEDARVTSDEDDAKKNRILSKMYLNMCICFNKIGKPEKTCINLREWERFESIKHNQKALIVKARALTMLNEFEHARKCIEMAGRVSENKNEDALARATAELINRKEMALYEMARSDELRAKFESEGVHLDAEIKEKENLKKQQEEDLEKELAQFKEGMEQLMAAFMLEPSVKEHKIKYEIRSKRHLAILDELCADNDIQLKLLTNESNTTLYYLRKRN